MRTNSLHTDTLSIRPANLIHAKSVCQLLRLSITDNCYADHNNDKTKLDEWLANKTTQNVCQWISNGNNFSVVAVDSNTTVIGFALVTKQGEILLCYLHPDYLHRGAGKRMLLALENYAQNNAIPRLYLESTKTAKAFYERNGFVYLEQKACRGSLECLKMEKYIP